MTERAHVPVLLKEAMEGLNIRSQGVYVDATFGFGGHAKEILKNLGPKGKIIGIEVDGETYDYSKTLFEHDESVLLYHCNFVDAFGSGLSRYRGQVDGILFDLGVNSYQIKESGRGMSFLKNEYLDMRLDQKSNLTASKVLNSYSREELEEILKNVDERFARVIARRITEERKIKKIETTEDLIAIVKSVKSFRGKIHPATLTFMALRLEVNRELENLADGLKKSIPYLRSGGRLVVISFHSGEDRIVKRFLREEAKRGVIKIVNKKVIRSTWEERKKNPLSRSAKMRVAEKC